jgi:hypothetical protein
MPVFQFEAINAGGERQTGLLDASSRSIASQSLQQRKRTVNRILQVFVFWEDLISPQIGASSHGESSAKFGERIVLATRTGKA